VVVNKEFICVCVSETISFKLFIFYDDKDDDDEVTATWSLS